ncbi:MAG: histidine kinase, partial [Bacteroidota bacterium]
SRTVLWERRGETPLRDPTREEERRVIARTIHDDLAQLLSSLKIELSSFKGNTDKLDFMVQDTIDTLLLLVEQCMNAVTSIITELRPIILDHLGLIPALKRLFSDFQKHTGISCDLLIREDARNKRKDFFQRDSL